MRKKLSYALLILSYFLLVFILIYSNIINPQYDKKFLLVFVVAVIAIWLIVPTMLSKAASNTAEDKVTVVLKHIAALPLYLLILPFAVVTAITNVASNAFKHKVKALLKNGFAYRKEVEGNRKIHYLSKENIVIKISEFDVYEISDDGGNTFACVENAELFSEEEKEMFATSLLKCGSCDYRDKDIYDPTRKLVELICKKY